MAQEEDSTPQFSESEYPNKFFEFLEEEQSEFWYLSGKGITDGDCDNLCKLWSEKHPHLLELVIRGNEITIEGLKKIIEVLAKTEYLQSLDLANNQFDAIQGMLCLSEALKTNASLKNLKLADCTIDDEALEILSEGLKCNESVSMLVLGGNSFSKKSKPSPRKGFQSFCEYLKLTKSLKELYLDSTKIEIDRCKMFCEAMKINSSLEMLNIEYNNLVPAEVKELCGFLEKNQTLKGITFDGNKICDEGAITLFEYLNGNKSLKSLFLANCDVSNSGVSKIAEYLKNGKNSLETLHLGGNKISDEGCFDIAKALENNTTLRNLYLDGNSIGIEAWRRLLKALRANTSLLEITVQDNPFCDSNIDNPDILLEEVARITEQLSSRNHIFKDAADLNAQTFVGHSLGHQECSDISLIFEK